jgi:hypothetical protein
MLEFKTVHSWVRPARVAVLLDSADEDWHDTVLRAIEWCSQHWGGAYFILIPTDGNSITPLFWSVLDAYDPDYIYPYCKTLIDWKIAKPAKYDQWLDDQVQTFSQKYPDSDAAANRIAFAGQASQIRLNSFGISPDLEQDLKQRLVPFHFQGNVIQGSVAADAEPQYPLTSLATVLANSDHPGQVTTLIPPADILLTLATAAIAGLFRDNILEKLGLARPLAIVDSDCLSVLPSLVLDQRISTDGSTALPFEFSMWGLGYYQKTYVSELMAPIFVVAGSSLEDFCLFYDLSRLRGQTAWVPKEFLVGIPTDGQWAHFERPTTSFLSKVMGNISSQIRRRGQYAKLVLVNGSGQPESLPEVAAALSNLVYFEREEFVKAFSIPNDVSDFVRSPRIVLERENFRSTAEPFVDGRSAGQFQTPLPRNFRYVNPRDHRWITEIAIDKCKTPRLEGLGERSIEVKNYSSNEIRTGKDGVAFLCPNNAYFGGEVESVLVRPKLAILDAHQLFGVLFEARGYFLTLCDKGGFTKETIAKMASLPELAETLRNPSTNSVLEKFLDLSQNKPEVFDEGVRIGDRRYLDFRAVEKLMGGREKAASVIDSMTNRGFFYRGFIFKCERCRNADWYDIEDVAQSFECQRCKHTQIYQKIHWRYPDEPQWYFKLEEVMFQALRSGCATTILALNALEKRAKDTFDFIPEFEIRRSPNDEKPLMEIDFACNLDGAVLLGEAKKEGRLGHNAAEEEKKLENDKVAATAIRASQVVFATNAEQWAEQTEARARRAFASTSITPVFLCGADL